MFKKKQRQNKRLKNQKRSENQKADGSTGSSAL